MPAGFDGACKNLLWGPLREGETLLRSLDRQIDALINDLYALTPAEIKIVEGATH
jgi:hypothetical protein